MPFGGRNREHRLSAQAGFEDRQHGAAGRRADHERSLAGGLQPFLAVLARERQQSEACAVPHLGVRPVGQQVFDDRLGARPDGGAPVQQSPRRPFHVGAVRRRHVLGQRRMLVPESTAGVGGNALAAVQDLDAVTGDAGVDLLVYETVRDAVIVVIDFDGSRC